MAVLVAAGEADAVLLAPGGLDVSRDPVLVDHAAGIERVAVVIVLEVVVDIVVIVLEGKIFEHPGTVHHRTAGEVLQGGAAGVTHGSVAVLAALGGHEHDAVTGLRTVDGGGGGVLEDFDRLDQGRIQILDAAHLQTIDDVERADVAAVGRITADTDVSTVARGTGGDDVHAGHLALQGCGGISRGLVLQIICADGSHSAGQVALPLYAVTDHHGLFQHLGVLIEHDVVGALGGDREGLGGVADALDAHRGPGGDGEREGTVEIGGCTDTRVADHRDGGADDGISVGIDDLATDGAVLGES